MGYAIKNWSKHQHFKDRTPPWIKLYRDILDDPDWHDLSGDDAKLLVGLWLIASEDESRTGELPDSRRLAFRLRMREPELKQALTRLSHWLIQSDIKVISERYQDDAPETETETETETEYPAKADAAVAAVSQDDLIKLEAVVDLYHQAFPEHATVRKLDTQRRKAVAARQKEYPNAKTVDWWEWYFAKAAESSFLTGKTGTWRADFDFLTSKRGFWGVIEGKYQ